MPYIAYGEHAERDIPLYKTTLWKIAKADEILRDFSARGYTLTLRQLYYQFVAKGLIPNNTREYDKLGTAINTGRLAGMLNWYHLEDRTRNLVGYATYESPGEFIKSIRHHYAIDWWKDQDTHVEVWVEKEALASVIGRAANKHRVDYFACRGYPSQSEMWRASQRMASYYDDGKECHIIHLGDHDPSGIDMTGDIERRFEMFGECIVKVHRIALNMDQVNQYGPPPNPAKLSDTRAPEYISIYGRESWELDALDPEVIEALIEDRIASLITDHNAMEQRQQQEEDEDRLLEQLSER